MKYVALVALALFVACSTVPKDYQFTKEQTVAMSLDSTTARVVQWCFQNDFAIVNNTGGILIANSDLKRVQGASYSAWSGADVKDRWADCGSRGLITHTADEGTINVVIQKVDNSRTRVIVNFTARSKAADCGCASNGKLEASLLSFLGAPVVPAPAPRLQDGH